MDTPQHILVVIDPTATQQPALARARELAHAFGARLELFVCRTPRDAAQATECLDPERVAQGLREDGIDTCVEVTSDNALHIGIVRKVLRSLTVARHERRVSAHLAAPLVAWKHRLAAGAPVPGATHVRTPGAVERAPTDRRSGGCRAAG